MLNLTNMEIPRLSITINVLKLICRFRGHKWIVTYDSEKKRTRRICITCGTVQIFETA